MLTQPIELRRLSSCSFDDALRLWNEGFKGYFVDMTLTLDRFIGRLHRENLSADKSLVAFYNDQPVGFLFNGIRVNGENRQAWNGGTAVIPEFRGKGIGRILVNAALDLYAEERVDFATLEAISNNHNAIALYASCGYKTIGRLLFLEKSGPLNLNEEDGNNYFIRSVAAPAVSKLPFYRARVTWQEQWQSVSVNAGEGLIVSDEEGVDVAYALFRRQCDAKGDLAAIVLHQCVVSPGRADARNITARALAHLYGPLGANCQRSTHNFDASNADVVDILVNAGFENFVEQVFMIKSF